MDTNENEKKIDELEQHSPEAEDLVDSEQDQNLEAEPEELPADEVVESEQELPLDPAAEDLQVDAEQEEPAAEDGIETDGENPLDSESGDTEIPEAESHDPEQNGEEEDTRVETEGEDSLKEQEEIQQEVELEDSVEDEELEVEEEGFLEDQAAELEEEMLLDGESVDDELLDTKLVDDEPVDTELDDAELDDAELSEAEEDEAASDETELVQEITQPVKDDGRAWYVVHCYSGNEDKVRHNILQRIESMAMDDLIFDVVVPTEDEVNIKNGERVTIEKKVFPGYILVNMALSEESWYMVRNTPGVTGFVGMGNDPTPLQPEEVARILKRMESESPRVNVTFRPGERVRIVDGPFEDFYGKVSEIDMDRATVRVMVNFFGRETPVELDFLQVEEA
jgi:transcriptional antiterminator NusG